MKKYVVDVSITVRQNPLVPQYHSIQCIDMTAGFARRGRFEAWQLTILLVITQQHRFEQRLELLDKGYAFLSTGK
jgi:hypothetical protein